MKKMLIRPIVIVSFVAIGGLPALADLATPTPRPAARVEMAEAGPSTADWESAKALFEKASDEMAAKWAKLRADVK